MIRSIEIGVIEMGQQPVISSGISGRQPFFRRGADFQLGRGSVNLGSTNDFFLTSDGTKGNRLVVAKIYYDDDADLADLQDKTVAILGYGSQGHAHAQNLRDSGCQVIVGQRAGSANYDLAVSHGFQPLSAAEATQQADVINLLLPDEVQGEVFEESIRDNLSPGNVLMCSHGFNFHFGYVKPPAGVRPCWSHPKAPATSSAVNLNTAAVFLA